MVEVFDIPSKKFKRRIFIELKKPAHTVHIFEADTKEIRKNELDTFINTVEMLFNCSCKADVDSERADIVCGCD